MSTGQRAKASALVNRGEDDDNSNQALVEENDENLNDNYGGIVAAAAAAEEQQQQNGSDGEVDDSDLGSVDGDGDSERLNEEREREELEDHDDQDDHYNRVIEFGPFESGGGTLADHMMLASFNDVGDDESDEDETAEVDLNFDDIIEHPYLQERYPERPRTIRDVLTYEYNYLRYQLNYDDNLAYKNGRVSRLFGDISNINDDIAILDHLKELQLWECTSLPENFKYLTNLRKLHLFDCTRSISVPKSVLETMHRIRHLHFQDSALDILNDLVDLPAVDSLEISSEKSRYPVVNAGQMTELRTALRRLRRKSNNRSSFRTRMKEIKFYKIHFSDNHVSELFMELIRTFPNVTKLHMYYCDVSSRSIENLAMNLKERIKTDKLFAANLQAIDLTKNKVFKSKEGLRAVIKLLDVIDNITHVGDWLWGVYYHESDRNDDAFKSLALRSRLEIYRSRIADYNDQEFKRLRLQLITMLNLVHQRRFLKSLHIDSGGHQVARYSPLSIWSYAMQKASTMRPRFNVKDTTFQDNEGRINHTLLACHIDDKLPDPSPWDEATEEVKMWRASAVFLLLREGLTSNDDWHERRTSSEPPQGRKRKAHSQDRK